MSTAQEIAAGRKENAQIDASSIVLHDPFLSAWVNRIGGALAKVRVRTDINYTFTVLDDPSINAFAIKGGFVHVNIGLLNFVSSDDDLAAALGHEMGHVELHHVTKGESANAVIGILEGIISILSLPAAVLTSIGGELMTEKYSRAQELQADHYGVSIMSKAGFDPHAAVDVMRRLGLMDPGPESRADKAFLDHPNPSDRVAHLLGYPELDHPAAPVIVARAIHDSSEGRYSYARALLADAPNAQPIAGAAAFARELDFALRDSGGLAAPDPRVVTRMVAPNDPQRVAAAAALKAAQANELSSLDSAKTDSRLGELELSDLVNHLQTLPAPNDQSLDDPSPAATAAGGNAKPESAVRSLNRDVIAIVNLTNDVFSTAPGLIVASRQPIDEMQGPLSDSAPLTPKYASLFAYYPRLTSDMRASTTQLVTAMSDARTAVANLRIAVQAFNDAERAAQSAAAQGDARPPARAATQVSPNMLRLLAAADAALAQASHASDEMYASQTVMLSSELTLLDLYSSPERYAAFARAIQYRFPGVAVPAYAQINRLGLPAGDVGCAAWLSFETARPMPDILETMKRANATCATLAADHHLLPESLEIAEGLLYEDYDDSPNPLPR